MTRAYATIAALALSLLGLATSAGAQAAQDLRVAEVITGRGVAGPYALAWTNIERGTEWVSVDGESLAPHVDYTVDAQTGTLAFARPLAAYQTARVVYFRRTDSAPKQAGPPMISLTTPALRRGGSALDLTASYSEAGPVPTLSYGLKAKAGQAGGSVVETTLLFSQPRQQGSSGSGAIGWRTAASTKVGGVRLTAAMARAEEGFVDSDTFGLSAAGQITTAQAEYQASGLTLASSYAAAETASGETVTTSQRVSYRASSALGVTASRSQLRSGTQVGETEAVELTSKPADRIDLRARYKESVTGGDSTTTRAVETSIRPTSSVTVGAGWVRQESGGEIEGQKATVAWSPSKRLQLEGEYAENPEDVAGRIQQATASRVGVRTRLGSLGLTASTWRREETAGQSHRHDLLLFLPLTTGSKVTMGYSIETSPDLGASLDRNTYRLGYSLIRGSDLSLSLEGQWLDYRGSAGSLSLRSETRAEARLGTRF